MLLSVAPMASASDSIFSEDELSAASDHDGQDKSKKDKRDNKSNNGKHIGKDRGARGEPRHGPPSWANNDDDRSDDDDSSDDADETDEGAAANSAPFAALTAPATVDLGSLVVLDASGSSDVDGDALTFVWSLDSVPALSTAAITGSGASATLVPDVVGPYLVSVSVSDGTETSVAQATIEAVIPNEPPLPRDDIYGTIEGSVLTVGGAGLFVLPGVLANDSDPEGDPLTASLETSPANGTIVFNADGSFTYTHNPGFVGTDTFTYRVSDGSGSAVGVVSIRVIDLP